MRRGFPTKKEEGILPVRLFCPSSRNLIDERPCNSGKPPVSLLSGCSDRSILRDFQVC